MRRTLHIVVWMMLSFAGCDAPAESGAARRALIVISGDTAGWITPCGCAANQSGGLARRGSYLKDLRDRAQVLYLDAGGAAAGTTDYQKTKFESILSGERALDVAAHNLGQAELELGAEYLRALQSSAAAVPFVSANARDAGGMLLAQPLRIVEHAGRRIAVAGVCSPRFAMDQIQIDEPRQSILAALTQHKDQYDALIVLAYLPEDELHQLAADLPEADAVIGGPTGQAIAPRSIGPAVVAAATNKGKFLIELELPDQSDAAWAGRVVEMSASLPDEPEQVRNIQAYLAKLAERDFPADETGLVAALPANTPAGYRIAGSDSCASCHSEDQRAWIDSRHAHAWQTIEHKGFHVDSYCQQCHTTGYGMPGGFVSRKQSPMRLDVGCENCHGPSGAHVENPKIRTPYAAVDQCVRCHDHENSPTFHQPTYWEKIRHGPIKTAASR